MRKAWGLVQGHFGGWEAVFRRLRGLECRRPGFAAGVVGFVQGFRSRTLPGAQALLFGAPSSRRPSARRKSRWVWGQGGPSGSSIASPGPPSFFFLRV